jgi:hypothetical protein
LQALDRKLGGAMPVSHSHGKSRAEAPRARDLPATPNAVHTVPDRDPHSGRFTAGNAASRRRTLKRAGKQLAFLSPDKLAPWAQPYAEAAREHAGDLLADLGMVGPMASPLAEELASARLVYRALLALGLAGDIAALAEARQWLREARQTAITLEALARAERGSQQPQDPHAAVFAAFGQPGGGK